MSNIEQLVDEAIGYLSGALFDSIESAEKDSLHYQYDGSVMKFHLEGKDLFAAFAKKRDGSIYLRSNLRELTTHEICVLLKFAIPVETCLQNISE